MKKIFYLIAVVASFLMVSCEKEQFVEDTFVEERTGLFFKDGRTILSLDLPGETKVNVGPAGSRSLSWNAGDRLAWNGTASDALAESYEGQQSAKFVWEGILNTPANLLYPASFYKDADHITIPQNQGTMNGADDVALGALSLYGTIDNELNVDIKPLCAIVRLQIKGKSGAATTINSVRFNGNNGEQVSGDFAIDYSTGALTAAGTGSDDEKYAIVECDKELSSDAASYVNIVVPAGTYEKGFTVTITAESDDESVPSMTRQRISLSTLSAGKIVSFPVVVFEENTAISSAEELVEFIENWNASKQTKGINVVLVDDIEFTDELSARLVATGGLGNRLDGDLGNNFYNGTFSGRGFSIKNLKSSVPIFGITGSRAVIDGIVLDESCEFTCLSDGPADFGPLVGRLSGTLSNCVSNASVTAQANAMSSIRYIGGLIARDFDGTVSGCGMNGDITLADGTYSGNAVYVGGIAGRLDGGDNQPATKLIEDSFMNGTITVNGTLSGQYMIVGGIVGDIKAGTVSGCETSSSAKIICSGKFKNNIGGIAGHVDHDKNQTTAYSANITDCTNNAEISFTSSGARAETTPTYIGGIVGQNGVSNDRCGAAIENCENNGKITTNCNSTTIGIGGVVGFNIGAMTRCTNNADIKRISALATAQSNRYISIGGVVGTLQSGDVSGLVNNGKVESENPATSTATTLAMGGVIGQLTNAPTEGLTVCACENYGKVSQDIAEHSTIFPVNVEGGIIGLLSSPATVSGCSNHGEVYMKYVHKDSSGNEAKVNGRSMVTGGIVGIIGAYDSQNTVWSGVSGVTLESDINYGKVVTKCWNNTTTMYLSTVNGGIAGIADGAVINNCINTDENPATVLSAQRGNQGGIVGYARNVTITNCVSTKNTDTNSSNIPHFCGGIAGQAETTSISNSTVRGASLRCKSSAICAIGGIVGNMDGTSSVASCSVSGIKLSDNTADATKFLYGAIVGTTASGAAINNCTIDGGWSTDSGANYTPFNPAPIASDSNWTGSGNTGGIGYDLTGTVTCSGSPLAGVVVSDGYQSVTTNAEGKYFINTALSDGVTCVNVSIPSGYMSPVSGGLPQFYRKLSTVTAVDGVKTVDFTLDRISSNPDKYTVIAYADAQIRPHSGVYDNIAFQSVSVARDFFSDIDEYASTVSGSNVIGISLGDQVHNNMDMFSTYKGADMLGKLDFPNFCTIGNHDYNTTGNNYIDAAAEYEANLAPVRYSFNIGNYHVIVMDNRRTVKSTSEDKGLPDPAMQWLESDLKYVSRTMSLIVCTHNALYMEIYDKDARERDMSASKWMNADGYTSLFAQFPKVIVLNGHTHSSYNYVYPDGNAKRNIEVHSITRCCGELWTNHFLNSCGTPRGYVVFSINGDSCTHQFKPVAYQTASCAAGPESLTYRDFKVSGGKFVMKSGKPHAGETLDTFYQIHAYVPGSDGAPVGMEDKVIATVFMYNRLWSDVTFNYAEGSVRMTQSTVAERVQDPAYTWLHDWYYDNYSSSTWHNDYVNDHCCYNVFSCTPPDGIKSGTVSATDEFGRTYTYPLNW